ncbi:alpha/beta hydrolase [Castellaniella sp.]|uniref:alpha/beta hydrolase n=1 Tax=Castellaniella sp. TaxID=1955812 RepID=UPI002AFF4584|nr:alpha/beta hydrolase [Castellaniella sp.]
MHRPYDNSQTVADEAAVLADFARRSRQVYQDVPHRRDVPYGAGPRCVLDVFDCPDAVETLVFIHGGYWQWCDKTDFAFIVPLLLQHRYRCVLLEYDLAPHRRLADIVRQVGKALDFLRQQTWAGQALTVVGHSAGAHLAACHLAHPAMGAVHLLSGVYELAPIRDTHLDQALKLSDEEIADCSPVRQALAPRVPCHLAVGAQELPELRWQSAHFAQRLRQACPDAPVSYRVLPDCNHYTILDAYCAALGNPD